MGRRIEVVDADPRWPQMFSKEVEAISSVIRSGLVAIHHIGSTAVPGLAAKPVIDILLEMEDVAILDRFDSGMEGLGYVVKGEFGIPGRRFYLKGLVERTHHIHAFPAGSHDAVRHLAVRDYLIARPSVSTAYGLLKRRNAERFRQDNDGYCEAKHHFVTELEKSALKWNDSRSRCVNCPAGPEIP